MYKNIYYDRFNKDIHVWDDTEGYFKFQYVPYAYVVDPGGQYLTIDGKRVSITTEWSREDVVAGLVYEHDVKPETRVLIDLYTDSDEVSTGHCVMFFDIEVAREGGYSEPRDANNTITSISYYDTHNRQFTCLILDKDGKLDPSLFQDVKVLRFKTEKSLLMKFIAVWNAIPITIATGWNVLGYDFIYLYNRIEKVVGRYSAKNLSTIKKVDCFVDRNENNVFRIAGISVLDYLELYKLFTFKELPNYTLDAVSNYELGRGKIQYEKDLDHLYETDPVKFIEYNIEDVRLVVDLDKKLDFIAIAQGTCHKGHVPYEDVYYTSRYMEGACLVETKKRGVVATKSVHRISDGGKGKGAFVKVPRPGRYSWVYDLDLTSLYPSNIMTLNISPETKWGAVLNWDSYGFVRGDECVYDVVMFGLDDDQMMSIPSSEFRSFLSQANLSVAANGILYNLHNVGLIPSLLDTWFRERKHFRALSDAAHEAGDTETQMYYHRKQHIQKILLNSLYGVLLLPSFRFYDKDNGEAVTLSGQQLIHFTTTIANDYYNTLIGTEGIDYCLYTDTDSVFYESMPLIRVLFPNHTEDEIPDYSIRVASDVQNFINSAYDVYAYEFHNVSKHRWNIKQELVAKRAFWGSAKKRYAMRIVRDGSKVVDKPDIKGFDSVRSNFPKLYRRFLEQLIVDILNDMDAGELNEGIIQFKSNLSQYSILEIMNPTSVKDMEKWHVDNHFSFKSGTPVYVKSALNYNWFLKQNGINTAPTIQSGDKILWAYLLDNPYGFDTMALRGYDDPEEVVQYVERYINRDKMFDSGMQNKLQSIWDDLGWGTIILNKNVLKFFDFE